MSQKIIVLSGAASDVLYALFTRGALASGDLPSKSGASELRDAGLAETRSVAAKRKAEDHFTFLTAQGQKFAIQYLAETDFGRENELRSSQSVHTGGLADCKKRFGEGSPMPYGGFPMPKRKVCINLSGLHEWKDGILSGAEVRVDIIQGGKPIHSEVFSGKASQPFAREVEVHASFSEIVAVHNRPDLKELKVSAEFTDVTRSLESADRLTKIISEQISQRLNKELQPGGLLYKR